MEKNLVTVFQNVKDDIKRGYYENSFGEEIEFFSKTRESTFYRKISKYEMSYKASKTPKIYVENKDSFLKVLEMGPSAAVLNMASFKVPGGGVERGSRAQEEDLFRRSDLAGFLYQYDRYKSKELGLKFSGKDHYPLGYYQVIYSPSVSIYRKPISYDPYYEPFQTNVITAAAIRKPELLPNGDLSEPDKDIMREKIRSVLRVALINGHSKIVLGAWGCGSYGLPASTMAELFKEVLGNQYFSDKFDEVCFAIIEDHNSSKTGGNYKPFLDVFGGK